MRAVLVALVLLVPAAPLWAFDGATTHAGLTEQAALTAGLDAALRSRLGWRRGLLERLALAPARLPRHSALVRRIQTVSSGWGWAVDPNLTATSLAYLALGSILESLPPSRERHHFLNPATGRGLSERHRYPRLARRLGLQFFLHGETSLAALVTGAAFDLTGRPADEWATASDNPFGLPAFWRHLRLAVTAPAKKAREHHGAMAMLCLGAVAHLLQDMACPSHVWNDFALSHYLRGTPRGSRFEAYVARQYGRFGIRRFGSVRPISRPSVRAYFRGSDSRGLADWTRAHFPSLGSLPQPARLGSKALAKALAALPPHLPIDWRAARDGGTYVLARDGRTKLAAVEVTERGVVRFWQDRRVHQDLAEGLLPKAVAYVAGLFQHLFRGRLLVRREGSRLSVRIVGVSARSVRLAVLSEDSSERRRLLLERERLPSGRMSLPVQRPRRDRTILIVASGRDTAGDQFLITSRLSP